MSEHAIQLREQVIDQASQHIAIIEQAAQDVAGSGATVAEAFPAPMQQGEARKDSDAPVWDEKQEAAARAATHKLGYGSAENVASGLSGSLVLVEAGLPWKYDFEETLIEPERPSGLVYAGSQWVSVKDDERAYFEKKHNTKLRAAATQYDVARFLAGRMAVKKDEYIVPIGYEIDQDNKTIPAKTGQVQHLGTTEAELPVYTVRTDREQLLDGKYRYQPSSAELFGLLSDMLKGQGDISTPIALLTTQLYASRVIDAVTAGLQHDRRFGVAMSGRQTRAEILSEPIKDDLPIEQVAGELHVAHAKNMRLVEVAQSQLDRLKGSR